MSLKPSGEMYLETIYVLSKEKTEVHSVDIAEHMNYSKPSVSRAIGLLKQGEYLTVDKDGFLRLTNLGISTAEMIFERHTLLTDLFIALGVSEEVASEDACKIEHVISEESFAAIKRYLNK